MSVAYEETETNETITVARLTGKVKWFNNKAGFGFVTACEGALKDKDVFVHYSSIQVPNDQYKYLVQGEYVDFELSKPEKGDHEYHAVSISGVKGGSLMCETRRLTQEKRPFRPRVYKTSDDSAVKPTVAAAAATSPDSAPRRAPRKTAPPAGPDAEGYSKPNRRGKLTVRSEK